MAEDTTEKQFSIEKIYIKDLSFESPNSPGAFFSEADWKPDTSVNLSWAASQVGDVAYEVVVTVTVTVKSNDKTAYLVEVQQAGIFHLEGLSSEEMEPLLSGYCPNIIFPFARQTIANVVANGGFPQLMLKPVDFDAAYAQNKQKSLRPEQTADQTVAP